MLPIEAAVFLTPLALLTLVLSFYEIKKSQREIEQKKHQIDQRIYETLILREVGERIGYELNIEKILDTIISSLTKLIPYSTASYMLLTDDPGKVIFRVHLDEAVNRKFIEAQTEPMLVQLNQVTGKQYKRENLAESLSGTIVDEGTRDAMASFWSTPLIINDRGRGVMAVASKKPGLYQGEEMQVLGKILAQANRAVNQLEKVLATEKGKLNAMVESLADGILMLDSNENLVVVNPAAKRMLGLAERENTTIFDVAEALMGKVDIRTKFEESLKYDKLVTQDEVLVNDHCSQLLVTPVKDSSGKILGGVVLFHDITTQKELERLRQDFTAMMVHELRAPLTVARGTADMFMNNPRLAGEDGGKELLANLQTSVNSMLALVNDLLDVAKIEAGKFQISKSRNKIGEVIAEKVKFFQPMAGEKKLNLQAKAAENIPEADFDRERISQVLNNLISNAIKFSSAGGTITISALLLNKPGEFRPQYSGASMPEISCPAILVSVSDEGVGIPPEKIPDLFSKFKQLTPSSGTKGTGLGLSIAKGIIEAHGGKIFVESEPGSGSIFHFTLPA